MTKLDTDTKLQLLKDAVDERKAENIEVLDLTEMTLVADYFVITNGTSNVHIRGIVDNVLDKMRAQGVRADRIEGYAEGRWVLVDYGDIVLHVFAIEEREFYDLETLWRATEERLAAR